MGKKKDKDSVDKQLMDLRKDAHSGDGSRTENTQAEIDRAQKAIEDGKNK